MEMRVGCLNLLAGNYAGSHLKPRCRVKRIFLEFHPRLTNFSLGLQNGIQPVKRKRALLASTPLRNNRSEAHRSDEQGGDGMIAPPPGGYDSFPMPEKTPRRLPSALNSPLRNWNG